MKKYGGHGEHGSGSAPPSPKQLRRDKQAEKSDGVWPRKGATAAKWDFLSVLLAIFGGGCSNSPRSAQSHSVAVSRSDFGKCFCIAQAGENAVEWGKALKMNRLQNKPRSAGVFATFTNDNLAFALGFNLKKSRLIQVAPSQSKSIQVNPSQSRVFGTFLFYAKSL